MVFNILSGNTDDHAKNFSFIMEKDGSWHLSPAYDLCFILKTATTPEKHHVFSIRGKHEDITISDLLDFAVQNDIKSPVKYIETVKDTLRGFRAFATANGVAPLFIDIIESRLRELSPDVFDPPVATYEVLKAQFARLKRQFQEERKASLNRPATDGELKDLAARFNEGRLF